MLLIDELLNVDFDKHCRDCPYNIKDFSKRFYEYTDSIDINTVITNPNIANDIDLLQKHYTLLLDYCYDLEDNNRLYKEKYEIANRKIYWKDKKIKSLKRQNNILETQITNIMNDRKEKRNGIRNKTQKNR